MILVKRIIQIKNSRDIIQHKNNQFRKGNYLIYINKIREVMILLG